MLQEQKTVFVPCSNSTVSVLLRIQNLVQCVFADPSLFSGQLVVLTRKIGENLAMGGVSPSELEIMVNVIVDYTHGFAISAAAFSNTDKEQENGMKGQTIDDYLRGLDWLLNDILLRKDPIWVNTICSKLIMPVLILLLASIGNITFSLRQPDSIETSLEYLLRNLEIWSSWLDPANEIGLLPEAEGRFMIPNTPILQTGAAPFTGSIGIMGFAQPIIISENGTPQGFNENERLHEPFPINYNDSIEDVFHKVPYLDRFAYQYGIQVNGRIVQIYRKPIEKESETTKHTPRNGNPL